MLSPFRGQKRRGGMIGTRNQRGMTMWGMIFILFILGFTLFVLFKLLPVYLNDLKVGTAMKSMQQEAKGGRLSRAEIIMALDKRLVLDDTQHVDVRKDLTFEAQGNQVKVRIAYEVVTPLFANVSILISFDHSALVSGGGG